MQSQGAKSGLFLLAITLNVSACMTEKLATSIEFISFKEALVASATKNEELGPVRAKDCTFRVLGFGPLPKMAVALDNLEKKQTNLKYMREFRVYRRVQNNVFWLQDCYEIAGYGYQ